MRFYRRLFIILLSPELSPPITNKYFQIKLSCVVEDDENLTHIIEAEQFSFKSHASFQNAISLTVILKIMHLKPLKNSLTRLCLRTRQALGHEENKVIKSFEGSFRNLNFSPSTSILLNFFFPFIDIGCFFSQV